MGSQTFLFAFICFIAYFQAFECKTLGRERKARSYEECKPGREDSCRYTKCPGGRKMIIQECTCPNMFNDRCPCIDHNRIMQGKNNKFIYQFNGESLYCECDQEKSGYCKKGCVDNTGQIHQESYNFEGDNGKYSCQCQNGTAHCSKGFTLPDIDSNRPGPVLPSRPVLPPLPGLPALPPRPPQLPTRP